MNKTEILQRKILLKEQLITLTRKEIRKLKEELTGKPDKRKS